MNERRIVFLSGSRAARSAAIALLLGVALSCKADLKTGPDMGPVQIRADRGNSQSAMVGTPVANPVTVLVTNELNQPVINVLVTFAVTGGGGSLGGNTAPTGLDGIATLPGWTLGTTAGANTLSATAAGLERHPITLTATGTPDAPALLTEVVPLPPTVQDAKLFSPQPGIEVTDQFGNVVSGSGLSITATLVAGNGALLGTATVPVDVDGIAHFTDLSLVGPIGTYTVAFNGPSLPTISSDVNLVPGSPEALAFQVQPPGAAQSGVMLTQQPVLQLRDASNNPVAQSGVPVSVTIASAGGGLSGTTTVASDAAGTVHFTNLAITGTTGSRALQFSAPGIAAVTSGPITVTAGPAALLSKTAGDNQLTAVGTAVPIDPVVTVTDGGGNGVAGVVVAFAVTSGNGHIANGSVTTDAQGHASSGTWTLGPVAGTNRMSAVVSGLPGSPAVFTATGSTVIGPPSQLVIVSGDGQSGVVGAVLAESLVVRLEDASGNGVPGVPVTWTALSGGGTLGPAAAVTDANGRLAASWTLGFAVGGNTAKAQAGGFQVTFAATGVAGQADHLAPFNGPATAQSGIILSPQPAIMLEDANGNPVAQANVVVTVSILSGGGTLGGTLTATTNALGRAVFSNLSLTGLAGPRVLHFTASGLSPANSGTIQLTAGAAANLAKAAGDGQFSVVGTPVGINPSVLVTDGAGNPVANVAVGFAVTGGGSIANGSVTTNAQGVASGGAWTLGPAVGNNSLTATSAGLNGSPAVFTATGVATAGQPTDIVIVSGDTQTGAVATALPESLVVQVVDGNGVGVPGINVQWGGFTGGGSVSPGTVTSDVSGRAAVAWTLGAAPGLNEGTATAATFTVTFSATAISNGPFRLALTTEPSTARSGFVFNPQPVISLQDSLGNPVAQPGVVVTALGSGGGILGGTLTATTSAGGVATFTNLKITGLVGPRTLTFTSPGLVPVTSSGFPLTAGTAVTLGKNAGDAQSAPVATALPVDVEVLATDGSGNPVPGVSVNFTVLTGGGSIAAPTGVTNAQGVATPGNWTLGPNAGSNTLRAASSGLGSSPLTFTATGTPGAPASIVKVSGDAQSGLIGSVLAESLVVRVADSHGNTIPGAQVSWSVLAGGGLVSPTLDVTDGAGLAATAWTVGILAGPTTVMAQLGSLNVTFLATILPDGSTTMHPVFSTYLSGTDQDQVRDIAVDAAGNIYVTGGTVSPNFPTTPGAYDRSHNGLYDAYVTKLNPQGQLIWSTFVGGPNYDRAYAIEVDAQGFVYIAGRAGDQFPVTAGAFQTAFNGSPDVPPYGPQDGFVCKIKPNGSNIVWCSYFGTDDERFIRDLDLDPQGNIYLASSSTGGAFPDTWFHNPYQRRRAGQSDGFVAKVANDGSDVIWATYIGGTGDEAEEPSLRVDAAGNIFVLYSTDSPDAPVPNGFDQTLGGVRDLYLVKLSNDGTQLLFGTYLGGSGAEDVETHELALDPQGNPVVGNSTTSSDFPVTSGAFQTIPAGGSDGTITRISADGSRILNSTLMGGQDDDRTEGISIDAQGYVYITGSTDTRNLPFLAGGFQPNLKSNNDMMVVKFSPDLSTVLYGTYVGGSSSDLGRAAIVTPGGDFIAGGNVDSFDFPQIHSILGPGGDGHDGAIIKFSPGP
ncbi:MAG: Ig-like domain-containing protein [Gemmatimonadota bacterium]